MRPTIRATAALGAVVALGACAGHHAGHALPAGLTYLCAGQPAMVVYNGHGYLPGTTARTPYLPASGEDYRQAPRATAQLSLGGRHYDMMADWAFEGLRYRSVEPYNATHALVWSAAGETARVSEVAIQRDQAERDQAERNQGERDLATCTRVRTVDSATAHGDSANPVGQDHQGEPAAAPHRR